MTPEPVTRALLVDRLADLVASRPGIVRVALDGPPCSAPDALAADLLDPLRIRSRGPAHVRATDYWRDASVRLEHGREDPDAFLDWLDANALRREVLDAARSQREILPSLRDISTNRATRAEPVALAPDGVVLVSGAFLQGLGLPFDLVVHLAVTPAARARRTPADERWTLPAFDRYDAEVCPAEFADVVVRWDDPLRPALDLKSR